MAKVLAQILTCRHGEKARRIYATIFRHLFIFGQTTARAVANDSGCSRRNVNKHLYNLVRRGILEKEKYATLSTGREIVVYRWSKEFEEIAEAISESRHKVGLLEQASSV